jgi:hypothetical protein
LSTTGWRPSEDGGPNSGTNPPTSAWRENAGFRNYGDYMLTNEFREGVEKLLEVARQKRTAIMCAEGQLVSDFLDANGVAVQHILSGGELRPHDSRVVAVWAGRERVAGKCPDGHSPGLNNLCKKVAQVARLAAQPVGKITACAPPA